MNAEPPSKAMRRPRTGAPTGPTMFPDGNHSMPRSPSTVTGSRDSRTKRARARRPTAKISRCCSELSKWSLLSGQCDGLVVHYRYDAVPVYVAAYIKIARKADVGNRLARRRLAKESP